jgi:hypothetical protein
VPWVQGRLWALYSMHLQSILRDVYFKELITFTVQCYSCSHPSKKDSRQLPEWAWMTEKPCPCTVTKYPSCMFFTLFETEYVFTLVWSCFCPLNFFYLYNPSVIYIHTFHMSSNVENCWYKLYDEKSKTGYSLSWQMLGEYLDLAMTVCFQVPSSHPTMWCCIVWNNDNVIK